ncbi:MAG: apolipoprotein N-acyltransferase, partial [Verrucomicrobiales bacterium]|nr:apolipoprotein N-acyltransferase [Verrucomicrobiales bacterium]
GLGVALHRNTVLMQNAALVGVTGLSFLPPLLAATGWINALRLLRHWRGQPVTRTRLDFTLSVVLLLSAAVYGLWQIRTFHPAERPVVRTLLIQPNVSQFVKWGREDILALYRQLDQRTRLYTEATGPTTDGFDLIVWPENAVPVNLDDSPEADAFHRSFFEPLLQTGNFSLLTGAQTRTPDGGGQNSAVLFSPQTYTPRQSASKQHLVPFGEYLPLRQQLPILERLLGHILPGDFVPGQGTQPLTLTASGESVGIVPLICFEDTVGRLARRFVRPGPQILANITNDGWFLHSDETEVHLANARFRAVELRRPLLRAANTGVTCFIDPLGRTLSQLDDPATGSTFIEGCLPGALRFAPGSALTFYARFGDVFSYLCLALTSSALLLHLSRRKKTHASTVEPTASHPTDHR